jgi:hypothetical protein
MGNECQIIRKLKQTGDVIRLKNNCEFNHQIIDIKEKLVERNVESYTI